MMLRKQQANSAWIQEEEARKCLNQPQMSPPVQPKMAPPNTATNQPKISPPLQPKMAQPNTVTPPVQQCKTSF